MKTLDLLGKYNIASTGTRRQIARQILAFDRQHFSAEDLLKKLKKTKSRVSRASTFRTLSLFCQKGILESVDLGKGFKLYELAENSQHHDHLYCLACGKILEFEDKNIESLQIKVCRMNQFQSLGHSLRILGLCVDCKKK